jgi:hypothetical protein
MWIDEWVESYGIIEWLGCMDAFLCCGGLVDVQNNIG